MKQIVTLVLFIFSSLVAFSNDTQGIIRGTIIEDATGLTVIGANIMVNELGTGTTTDLDGAFALSLNQECSC